MGYEKAPIITFEGGNIADDGLPHPDFEPCEARAIVNANGEITDIEIINPGAYYYENPTVLINGDDSLSNQITARASSIAISWVTISTHTPGAAGLGYVGAAGSHVDASGGSVGWGVIAHELGHNFGLLHANRFSSQSERANSDEGNYFEYGNPFAVMGSGSGHMTLPAKVAMSVNGFGYHAGTSEGADVATLLDRTALENAVSNNLDLNTSEHNNTFRIYRHDYETFPHLYMSRTLSSNSLMIFGFNNFEKNNTYQIKFVGAGEGAKASLSTSTANYLEEDHYKLTIMHGGKGFDGPRVGSA